MHGKTTTACISGQVDQTTVPGSLWSVSYHEVYSISGALVVHTQKHSFIEFRRVLADKLPRFFLAREASAVSGVVSSAMAG